MLGSNAQISDSIQDLTMLNNKLGRLAGHIGTRQDNASLHQTLDTDRKAAKKLCQDIMAAIQKSTQLNAASGRRFLLKLSKQFETQLTRFQDVEKQILAKRSAGMLDDRTSLLGSGTQSHQGYDQDQEQVQKQEQHQQVDIKFMEYDLDEVRQRHQGIQQIEEDILEIGEMFRDLHTLVQEANEPILTIEEKLTGSKDHVKDAHEELLKAEKYQKKARKKKCCLIFMGLAGLGALVLIISFAT